MTNVTINFESPVKMYGNSVACAEVVSDSANNATTELDSFLNENYPNLGRAAEPHFVENGVYYFSVNE